MNNEIGHVVSAGSSNNPWRRRPGPKITYWDKNWNYIATQYGKPEPRQAWAKRQLQRVTQR